MSFLKKTCSIFLFFLLALCILPAPLLAQTTTVPDLTGLNVPQAAAALNTAGLALGVENAILWSSESPVVADVIGGQLIDAGTSAEPGSAVDVTVYRSPNVTLIYDDNDLTLVNRSNGDLNVNDVTFNALDGNNASFAASQWTDTVRGMQCLQVWSVGRNGAKGLDECRLIQTWRVTTNPAEHFWTGAGGTTRFSVSQGGTQIIECEVANPGRCDFYLPANGRSGDITEYVYFAYTQDRLAIINTSEDRWMMTNRVNVINNFAQPPVNVALGTRDLFGNPEIVGDIRRLAPGQCLLFTNSNPASDAPPQPCEVIARLDIGPSVIFWGAAFDVESVTDDTSHSCPAGVADRLTLCVMPR